MRTNLQQISEQFCDGSLLQIGAYNDLFNVIGTAYAANADLADSNDALVIVK